MSLASAHCQHAPRPHLTFTCGHTHFALDSGCIRYITTRNMLTMCDTPSKNGQNEAVFLFEDKPLRLFSFNHVTNNPSLAEECDELKALLRQRREDHIQWMNALESSLRDGLEFTKATDPHKCAFGLWYDAYQPWDDDLGEILQRFDKPHKHIHSLAETLLHKAATGQKDAALETMRKERNSTLKLLLELFDSANNRLDDAVRPVILILEVGDKRVGLELDNVRDMVDVDSAEIITESNIQQESFVEGFFHKADQSLHLVIDPQLLVQHLLQKSVY